jgi:hypothetical protein
LAWCSRQLFSGTARDSDRSLFLTKIEGIVRLNFMALNTITISLSLPKKLRADIERKLKHESYASVSD